MRHNILIWLSAAACSHPWLGHIIAEATASLGHSIMHKKGTGSLCTATLRRWNTNESHVRADHVVSSYSAAVSLLDLNSPASNWSRTIVSCVTESVHATSISHSTITDACITVYLTQLHTERPLRRSNLFHDLSQHAASHDHDAP